MGENKHAFWAGLFILLSLIATMAIVIGINGVSRLFEEHNRYTVDFKAGSDLGGLSSGNVVQVYGIRVGQVESVKIEPPDDDDQGKAGVRVIISMPQRYELREGAVVEGKRSLTGDPWLLVTDMGEGKPLSPDEPIEGKTFSFNELIAQAQGVIQKAGTALDNVSETAKTFTETGKKAQVLITRVDGKVEDIVEQYDKLTTTGTEALVEIRDVFGDTKGDIRDSMANVRQITATVNEKLPAVIDEAKKFLTNADKFVADAQGAVKHLDVILDDGKAIAKSIRNLLADNRVKLDRTMTLLKQASAELKGGIEDIRAAPWRLLYKPQEEDIHNLKVYAIARRYAEAAENLDDAAQALRYAAEDPNTDPERLEKLKLQLEEQYRNFDEVQAELWRRFEP